MAGLTELHARYGHSMTEALERISQLEDGGCARDQKTTQYCAEVVERDRRIAELEAENRHLKSVLADETENFRLATEEITALQEALETRNE